MDELIVDLRHQTEIVKLLDDEPELRPGIKEENDKLELMRIGDFHALDSYAARLRRQYINEFAALAIPSDRSGDLDVLMYDLRVRFEREFGFTPVMERNSDSVIGLPQHKSIADPIGVDAVAASTAADTDGQRIRIGVVDTALVPHPSFPADLVTGTQVTPSGAEPLPVLAAHSTFLVGLIRHQAPAAEILVRAGLDADRDRSSVWRVACEIADLQDQHLDILNLSLGVTGSLDAPPMALRRAIDRLGQDVLVIAAAGNRKGDQHEPEQVWPAAMTDVVAVGATNAIFSMTGPWVDCSAAGVFVTSTFPATAVRLSSKEVVTFGAGLAKWSGTSFAAATVTGAVAARMSRTQGMSAREAFAVLLADNGQDPVRQPTP
jgi:subtilisin family serine protease